MMEGIPYGRRSEAQPDEAGSFPISERGLEALRVIVGQERAKLTETEREKLLDEMRRDPELFDPSTKFSESKTDVSVRIPVWVFHYLERRKRVTDSSVSKQIANIVTEYVAREILRMAGRDE